MVIRKVKFAGVMPLVSARAGWVVWHTFAGAHVARHAHHKTALRHATEDETSFKSPFSFSFYIYLFLFPQFSCSRNKNK